MSRSSGIFDKKSSPNDGDPVTRLVLDVENASFILAKAVNAAREGVRGVSYEDWFLRKKINESLFKARMQVISMEP
jgi:hypothetical protein